METRRIVKTRRELASALGLKSEETISRYCARGMPQEANGGFDVEKCQKWRQENIRPRSDGERLTKWKARHEREKAKLARLKRQKEEGRLIDIEEICLFIVTAGESAQIAIDIIKELECPKCKTQLNRMLGALLETLEAIGPIASIVLERHHQTQPYRIESDANETIEEK